VDDCLISLTRRGPSDFLGNKSTLHNSFFILFSTVSVMGLSFGARFKSKSSNNKPSLLSTISFKNSSSSSYSSLQQAAASYSHCHSRYYLLSLSYLLSLLLMSLSLSFYGIRTTPLCAYNFGNT